MKIYKRIILLIMSLFSLNVLSALPVSISGITISASSSPLGIIFELFKSNIDIIGIILVVAIAGSTMWMTIGAYNEVNKEGWGPVIAKSIVGSILVLVVIAFWIYIKSII